jgi:hypothetical protein
MFYLKDLKFIKSAQDCSQTVLIKLEPPKKIII